MLVGSKLLHGLHTLPLKDDLLNKIEAFHLIGLRRILDLKIHLLTGNANESKIRARTEKDKIDIRSD